MKILVYLVIYILKYLLLLNIFRNFGISYELLRDWFMFSNIFFSVIWLNFDFEYKDRVKIELKVINGVLNFVI